MKFEDTNATIKIHTYRLRPYLEPPFPLHGEKKKHTGPPKWHDSSAAFSPCYFPHHTLSTLKPNQFPGSHGRISLDSSSTSPYPTSQTLIQSPTLRLAIAAPCYPPCRCHPSLRRAERRERPLSAQPHPPRCRAPLPKNHHRHVVAILCANTGSPSSRRRPSPSPCHHNAPIPRAGSLPPSCTGVCPQTATRDSPEEKTKPGQCVSHGGEGEAMATAHGSPKQYDSCHWILRETSCERKPALIQSVAEKICPKQVLQQCIGCC